MAPKEDHLSSSNTTRTIFVSSRSPLGLARSSRLLSAGIGTRIGAGYGAGIGRGHGAGLRATRHAPHVAAIILAALASACSSDGVDLGGGVRQQQLVREGRCAESPIIEESVLVTSQEELAALEGCEQIEGDLEVQLFADADLSPLHALRVVDAGLVLGSSAVNHLPADASDAEFQAVLDQEAALDGVWLTSLTGLESLQRVGSLLLSHSGIVDFEPLSGLTRVGGGSSGAGIRSGELLIENNAGLVNFAGLENARGVVSLQATFNAALESLEGLALDANLDVLNLMGSPRLVNIDALSAVTSINIVNLEQLGIGDLQALASLTDIGSSLFVVGCPALVDASALSNVQQCQSILFQDNAALKTLPSLQNLGTLPDLININGNPELESIVLDSQFSIGLGPVLGGRSRDLSMDSIIIGDNAKLRSVSFAPALSEAFGLKAAEVVAFERNPSLESIDFGGFQRADVLFINDNPALANVVIGDLATVDSLELTGNPALDTSVFDGVRTFERIESDEPFVEPPQQ